MRSVAVSMQTRLAMNPTTLAWIVVITKRDAGVIRLHSAGPTALSIGGNSYTGTVGFSNTSVSFDSDGAPASIDLELPIWSGGPITFADVINRRLDGAAITVSIIDFRDLTATPIAVYSGTVGDVDYSDTIVSRIEVKSRWARSLDLVAPIYQPGCRHAFGDANCGVDVESLWTDTATVASVVSRFQFTITGPSPTPADGYYANGAVKFTTGDNAADGLAYEVRDFDQSGALVSLWVPARADIEVGNTLQIHKGCAHTTADCIVHSNLANYGGFPFLPSEDFNYHGGGEPEKVLVEDVPAKQSVWGGWTGGIVPR